VATTALLTVATIPVFFSFIVAHETGWRFDDPFVRVLIGSACGLASLAWVVWRVLPMRMAEVTFDPQGITISETQNGRTRVAAQTIGWSEIYGLLGTNRDTFFGIELHTNGPPPGRRIELPMKGGPQLVKIARPFAKAARYRIKPVFTKGFMSEEIWRLTKEEGVAPRQP
jgi:hypothetical protein